MVRRAPAELIATWAGGMLQVSPKILRAWMRTSNVERRSSRLFSCWGSEAIVETRGSCEKAVTQHRGCGGAPMENERCGGIFRRETPRANTAMPGRDSPSHGCIKLVPIARILRFATNANARCLSNLPDHNRSGDQTHLLSFLGRSTTSKARSWNVFTCGTARDESRNTCPPRDLNSSLTFNAIVRRAGRSTALQIAVV